MEPKNPEQEKDKKEEEKSHAQSIPPNTTNCPSDPKQKGFAPKCQGCPFRAQCQQGAQAQGPSIDEQVKEKLVNVGISSKETKIKPYRTKYFSVIYPKKDFLGKKRNLERDSSPKEKS